MYFFHFFFFISLCVCGWVGVCEYRKEGHAEKQGEALQDV